MRAKRCRMLPAGGIGGVPQLSSFYPQDWGT
jgi:hypothetical protein